MLNPLSFLELSVQVRSIWLEEKLAAERLLGAAGIFLWVFALAAFE